MSFMMKNDMTNYEQLQMPNAEQMPVTMADIEKPEIRMKRLNSLLHDTQIELLNAKVNGKTRQERKSLKKRCQELDEKLDNAHNEYQDYLSESNANSQSGLNPDRALGLPIHTQQSLYEIELKCQEKNIRSAEAALCLVFTGIGYDPTSLLNDVRKNPSEFADDKRPVVRDFCEAIKAYNRAEIAVTYYTATTSLKNLREYVDHRIENLDRFENLVESCMAQILELEKNVSELTLRSDARILKLEKAVNFSAFIRAPPDAYKHAATLLCMGDTTGFDCLSYEEKKSRQGHNIKEGNKTTSFLAAAVISGDCEIVKHVLEGAGCSTYDDPKRRYTLSEYLWNADHPLCYATSRGHLDIVRLLFECGLELKFGYELFVPKTSTGDKIRDLILGASGIISRSVAPNPEWLKLII